MNNNARVGVQPHVQHCTKALTKRANILQ